MRPPDPLRVAEADAVAHVLDRDRLRLAFGRLFAPVILWALEPRSDGERYDPERSRRIDEIIDRLERRDDDES